MTNVRASVNMAIAALVTDGTPVLTQPHQTWDDPCFRLEWGDAEVPRGAGFLARNLRVHFRGTTGERDAELKMRAIIRGLGLVNPLSVATVQLYDYASSTTSTTPAGVAKVERSLRGVSNITPGDDSPNMRHLVFNAVIVYQQED